MISVVQREQYQSISGFIGYDIEMLMRLAERYLMPWKGKG